MSALAPQRALARHRPTTAHPATAIPPADAPVAPRSPLWYRALGVFARFVLRVFCRLRIEGAEHIPPAGPLIVASNHCSYLDTILLGCACPRMIRYLIAEDWARRWYMRPVCRLFRNITVPESGGAAAALRVGWEALRAGGVVGVFPEGHLSRDGRLQPAREGIGLLAARSGVDILPVALIGAYQVYPRHRIFPRPGRIRVVIGEPIRAAGKDRRALTAETMDAVERMLRS